MISDTASWKISQSGATEGDSKENLMRGKCFVLAPVVIALPPQHRTPVVPKKKKKKKEEDSNTS